MSRKRNSNRKSKSFLHTIVPCPSIEEYKLEYYRPGCYCIPQGMPNGTPYTCAYLHEYVPQWRAACNTATYVVDSFGMVYYLSDFEHRMQFPNDMVEADIDYHISTYSDENECGVPTDEEEEEAASPRKRERLENESDAEEAEREVSRVCNRDNCHAVSTTEILVEPQVNAILTEHGYYVEEPADMETKAEQG